MNIDVYSRGFTRINVDPEWQEPGIRSEIRLAVAGEVASEIIDCTDTERSNISHDEYAVVTEDDGTVIWQGWLTGDKDAPPPAEALQTRL